jgi:Ca-activated chloride channel family protein
MLKVKLGAWFLGLLTLFAASRTEAAGNLTPRGSDHAPIQILDHHVNVTINNGFAQTEVIQTFYNPNEVDLEAIYSFPVPKSASLSEVTVYIGELEIEGEVLEKEEATRIYEEERDQGNNAGLASKNGYQTFEFAVSPVRAQDETRIRFVYYQPLEIDTGVGRYVYPLEEGGTDDLAASFWIPNEKVEGSFSVNLELKSAWPLADVRVPGFESDAQILEVGENHYQVKLERQGVALNRDFVFYYRLQDNLPGRVELVAYRADEAKPGTFMMVVTPGLDLKPLNRGADYTFVLDVSGSMEGKIHTLAQGVVQGLGKLSPDDRFRIITFNNRARHLTRGWLPATSDNVHVAIGFVKKLKPGGGTNLYDGLSVGLEDLNDDRASSIVLVTDAVTNTGVVDPKEFHRLMQKYDVRVFSFLMGNNANWPLMRTISDASGGFWKPVSNSDDIIGEILLAKSKITHESLHDARIRVKGVKVFDATDEMVGKIYRGQQLVLFGRYEKGGTANVTLDARMTGEDKSYSTTFQFPDLDTDNPEIERLWALNRIETVEAKRDAGFLPESEARPAIVDLGLAYQLVTDHTSMVVLPDETFATRGIDRRNRRRTTLERQAQAVRSGRAVRNHRVDDSAPMFQHSAPATGRGGGSGAIDPVSGMMALALAGWAVAARRRKKTVGRESR